MDSLFDGIKIVTSPYVPSELPVVTFDPLRKCTWASESYRAEVNAWLLARFGTQQVAFMFNTKHLFGSGGFEGFAINPRHAAMLKMNTPRRGGGL